jgi:hypothetical protein
MTVSSHGSRCSTNQSSTVRSMPTSPIMTAGYAKAMVPVISGILAHAGGWDEMAIILFPLFVGGGVWLLTRGSGPKGEKPKVRPATPPDPPDQKPKAPVFRPPDHGTKPSKFS